MGIRNQIISTAIVSYLCMTTGVVFTWPSSVIKLFSSENTTLNRVMTDTEISLLGGLSSAGALCSIPFTGILMDSLGRKYTCIGLMMLQVIGWCIVVTFSYVSTVLAGVFIAGLSCCMYLVVPVYVSEFCQESIRGAMTSAVLTMLPVGWTVAYLLGGLEYYTMNYCCLSLFVVGSLLLFLLRDSPLHLAMRGLEEEAAEVIAYYRGAKLDSKEVHEEILNIKRSLNPEFDLLTPETEKLQQDQHPKESLTTWGFLKKSCSTRRALVLALVLCTATVFQGQLAVQVYAEPLFSQAVPNMSPIVSSVIFAVVNIFAALLVAYLVDGAGRRPLMIYSSLMTAAFAVLLGAQIQFAWAANWVTALLIYLFCFTYTTGAGTIPFVISAEIFLPEIKNFATIISYEYTFLGGFTLLFIFRPVVSALGLGPVFYIFSLVCLLTAAFCVFFMPETKGLSVDVIQHQFYAPPARNKA